MPKGRLRHCVCVCVKRFDSKTGAASLLGAAAPSSITQPGCRFSRQRNWGRISGAPWNSKAHKYPRTGQRPLIDKPSRLHSFQRNQIASALLHRTLLPFVCAELVQIRPSTLSFQSENSNVVTFWKICSNHPFFLSEAQLKAHLESARAGLGFKKGPQEAAIIQTAAALTLKAHRSSQMPRFSSSDSARQQLCADGRR